MGAFLKRFGNGLATGDFVVRERMRFLAALVAGLGVLVFAALTATAQGGVDVLGRPLGTDFSSFYATGQLVLSGHAADAFDPALLHARQQALFGAGTPFYAWQYPPLFLLIVTPFALLPYTVAWAVWQGATLILYLLAVRAIVARSAEIAGDAARPALWLLLALGFPAVFLTIGHGQNAFLSAALIGGGLAVLDRRPWMAGVMFGLLAYKPQLGVMIPFALIAAARWRAFAAATVTVLAFAALTTMILGPDVWRAFLASTGYTRVALLEQGGPGWEKLQTAFAWVRLWGGTIEMAYAAQIAVTVTVAAGIAWLWRSAEPFAVKAAALCIGAVIGTPFSLDYDMMLLAPAIAFLAADGIERGFAPYEKTALAGLWLAPLVARSVAGAALIPIGFIAMAATFSLLLTRRAASPRSAPPAWQASGTPRNSAR